MAKNYQYLAGEFLRLEVRASFLLSSASDNPHFVFVRFAGWFEDAAVVEDANGKRSMVDTSRLFAISTTEATK